MAETATDRVRPRSLRQGRSLSSSKFCPQCDSVEMTQTNKQLAREKNPSECDTII